MTLQTYNIYDGLTSVDYVSVINIEGTYNNGVLNNGIDAFLNIPSNTFYVDNNQIKIGDTILLVNQTNSNENGIYICIQTDDIYSFSVIKRRPDFQSTEQIRSGQYLYVGSGELYRGSNYCVIEPLPNKLGIDPLLFICTSPSFKKISFTQDDFTDLANVGNVTLISGVDSTFENPINTPDPLNHAIALSGNKVTLNGVISGYVIADGSLLSISDTLSSSSIISASASTVDMTNATVEGAFVSANLLNIGQISVPTDISNVVIQWLVNSSSEIIESVFKITGDANYLIKSDSAVNYIATAGTSAGQAGDTTHCNAQNVLKININGNDKFIPLFDTN